MTCRMPFRLSVLLTIGCALLLTSGYARSADGGVPDYRISAEDLLEVSVWKEPDLQKEVIVRPDGGISFPLVGDIQAAGKTPEQLEREIARQIENYIPDAVVTVSVVELRGLRIS